MNASAPQLPLLLGLLFGLIVLLFYVPFTLSLLRAFRSREVRRRFFRAVQSILARNSKIDRAAHEIRIIYKRLCEVNTSAARQFRSPRDFLEDLFMRVSILPPNRFKEAYGFEITDSEKGRIMEIVDLLREEDPFGSVSGKHGNLLNVIYQALATGNKDLGQNSTRQLADDIEILESTIAVQSRKNQLSMIVSVIGVILTLVFGALTVAQTLSRSAQPRPETNETQAKPR